MLHILSLIRDTNALCRTLDEPLLVISLEFLEAFDKVAIDFLFAALLKFRCGANFSQWYPLWSFYPHAGTLARISTSMLFL